MTVSLRPLEAISEETGGSPLGRDLSGERIERMNQAQARFIQVCESTAIGLQWGGSPRWIGTRFQIGFEEAIFCTQKRVAEVFPL